MNLNGLGKTGRYLLALGAALALLLLAASLAQVEFRAGWLDWTPPTTTSEGEAAVAGDFGGRLVMAGGLVLIATLLTLNALLAHKRNRPLPTVNLSGLWLVLTFLLIALLRPEALKLLAQFVTGSGAAPAAPGTPAPAPTAPTALPEGWFFLLSLLAAGVLVGGALWVWQRTRRPAKPAADSLQQLTQTAQTALLELQGGGDLQNIIARCYQEMSLIVAEKRDLYRQAHMTPREFVQKMEAAGLPGAPVEKLTALFELTRYSAQPLGAAEAAQAEACLTALATALAQEAPAASPKVSV